MRNGLVSALCLSVLGLCAVTLPALPAFADIKAFNAAVAKGDFAAATNEAAATWPGLSKTRSDIGLIANEFGYAAIRSGDFAAAKTYAEFAVADPAISGDAELLALASLVRDLARHRLTPGADTRTALSAALKQRAAMPGFDNISYLAADGLIAQEVADKAWKALAVDAAMSASMAVTGGSLYVAPKRRFESFAILGRYMDARKPATLDDLRALQEAIVADIDAAPSDDAAKILVPIYWDVYSLKRSIERDVASRTMQPLKNVALMPPERSERFGRLVSKSDGCGRKLSTKDPAPVPSKLSGVERDVTVVVDIDDSGRVANVQIRSGLQTPSTTKALLNWVKLMRFEPEAPWDASRCKMAKIGHVIDFEFQGAR